MENIFPISLRNEADYQSWSNIDKLHVDLCKFIDYLYWNKHGKLKNIGVINEPPIYSLEYSEFLTRYLNSHEHETEMIMIKFEQPEQKVSTYFKNDSTKKRYNDIAFQLELNLMEPTNLITFGKYKGKEIWEIIMTDENYMYWLIDNVEGFWLDKDSLILWNERNSKIGVENLIEFNMPNFAPIISYLFSDKELKNKINSDTAKNRIPKKFTHERKTLKDWIEQKERQNPKHCSDIIESNDPNFSIFDGYTFNDMVNDAFEGDESHMWNID